MKDDCEKDPFEHLSGGMEALMNCMKSLGNHLKWTSVEVSFPESDKNVLVYSEGDNICIAYHIGRTGWWSHPCSGDWDNSLIDVTHWMPLPNPPCLDPDNPQGYPAHIKPFKDNE